MITPTILANRIKSLNLKSKIQKIINKVDIPVREEFSIEINFKDVLVPENRRYSVKTEYIDKEKTFTIKNFFYFEYRIINRVIKYLNDVGSFKLQLNFTIELLGKELITTTYNSASNQYPITNKNEIYDVANKHLKKYGMIYKIRKLMILVGKLIKYYKLK